MCPLTHANLSHWGNGRVYDGVIDKMRPLEAELTIGPTAGMTKHVDLPIRTHHDLVGANPDWSMAQHRISYL